MSEGSNHDHGATKWIESASKKQASDLGARVAIILDRWKGIHNVSKTLSKAEWDNAHYISFPIYGGLSTFDSNGLTKLVFLAHDLCVRLEIEGASNKYLRLIFSIRERSEGDWWNHHPTLEQAVEWHRERDALITP